MTSQQANASTFRRPEITRSSDNLAKDQRKMLETQRRRLQFTENIQRREFNALIESKIYSNFQNNVDYCMNICENKKQTILASPLSQLYSDSNGKNSVKTDLNMSCLNNCIQKKYESFDMLMHVR